MAHQTTIEVLGSTLSRVGVYMKRSVIDKYSTFDRHLKEKINE